MEDRVDILLTTYNTDIKYLKLQLDSILNQTHENFRLIISDDCSTRERVKKLLKEYEKKDKRIEVFLQTKNLGVTKSFAFLLDLSNAEYIAFSDHDDIWEPTKIEESLKMIKEKNVDLVYCDAKQIDKDGNVLQNSYLRYKNMPIINNGYYRKILPFSRHIAIGCSQLFTKRVKEIMLPFTDKTIVHDWQTTYIASRLNGIYCIDKPLLNYRIHDSNVFGGRSLKQNMKIWKEKNGNSYESYLKYRYKVITETYLSGVLMCKEYSTKIEENNNENEENSVIKYFKKAQSSKMFYISTWKYNKYLGFSGIGKRKYKEKMILHFPLLSYMAFKML